MGPTGRVPSTGRALTAMLKLQLRCAGATLAGNDDLTTVTEEAEDFLASVEGESVNWQGAGAVGAAGAAMQRGDLDKRIKPLRPCQFIDPFIQSFNVWHLQHVACGRRRALQGQARMLLVPGNALQHSVAPYLAARPVSCMR